MKKAISKLVSKNRSSRQLGSAALLFFFFTLQVFAGSGSLHQAIHSDAASPNHHCVVTLLTQGQVNVPVGTGIWMAFSFALIFSLPLLQQVVRHSLDLRLAPGRAPPRF